MTNTIVLRAQDPASCVRFLGGLGIGLDAPNPMHPDAWRGFLTIHIEVVAGEPGTVAMSIGTANALGLARRLAERGGSIDFSQVRSDPPIVVVSGPNGERVAIEERGERPSRPAADEGMICHVRGWLNRHVDELRRVVELASATNPRILGPVSLGGRRGDSFSLVLDGAPDADLSSVDRFLASIVKGPIGLRTRSASTLPPSDRERLDALAFPI